MKHGRFILQLQQQRLSHLEHLKKLLLAQQAALLQNVPEELDHLNEEQIYCIEQLQEVESRWKDFLQQKLAGKAVYRQNPEYAVLPELDDQELLQYENLRTRIRAISEEIRRLKENNQVLIENSLGFVRTIMRTILESNGKEAGYRPDQKPVKKPLFLDKTI